MKVCEAIRGNFRSAGARVIRAVETFAILGRFSLEHRSRSIRRDKERDRVRREEGGRERERESKRGRGRLFLFEPFARTTCNFVAVRSASDTLKKAAGSIVSLILTSIKCNRV